LLRAAVLSAPLCKFGNFGELFHNVRVIFADVRQGTGTAILDTVFGIAEIAAAALAERIKRAVAEKAVKIVRIVGFMAGEKLACFVAEKRVVAILRFFLQERGICHKILLFSKHVVKRS
jgi:hypothetical protein